MRKNISFSCRKRCKNLGQHSFHESSSNVQDLIFVKNTSINEVLEQLIINLPDFEAKNVANVH